MSEIKFNGIWLSKVILDIAELNIKEKIILALAINLYKAGKKCFVSNKVISKLIEVKQNRVSKLVSSLRDKGHIRVKIKYKENSKEIEFREIIPIVEKVNGYCSNEQEGIVENGTLPIGENDKDIINNNINKNYNNNQKDTKYVPYIDPQYQDVDFSKYYAT